MCFTLIASSISSFGEIFFCIRKFCSSSGNWLKQSLLVMRRAYLGELFEFLKGYFFEYNFWENSLNSIFWIFDISDGIKPFSFSFLRFNLFTIWFETLTVPLKFFEKFVNEPSPQNAAILWMEWFRETYFSSAWIIFSQNYIIISTSLISLTFYYSSIYPRFKKNQNLYLKSKA